MAETTTQLDPMEALKALILQMNDSNRDQMIEFARELKKPSEREQRKLDEEDAKLKRAQTERLELGRVEMARIENNRRGCPHARINQATGQARHKWGGQVHSPSGVNPYFVPTCLLCHTQVGKIPATTEMLTNGVNLDQYPLLNYEVLAKWAEQYKA